MTGKRGRCLLIMLLSVSVTGSAAAQNIVAYPARGQTQEQQDRDRYDCFNWAVQQTGYNPMEQQAGARAATQPPATGGVVPGAAKGAAVGAVGGAIAGDAGKGAAIGAATGGLLGGFRRRQAEIQQSQAREQQAAAGAQQSAGFNRAMAACLQGRGYAVN